MIIPGELPEIGAIRVLVVVALPKELAAMKAVMEFSSHLGVENDPNVYVIGYVTDPGREIARRPVLICQSGMGNNNASTTATDAMRSFPQIEHIIMCGIAGGCPNPDVPDEHVRLGDIVYCNEAGIIEYDFVKQDSSGSTVRSSLQKPSKRMLAVIGAMIADEILGKKPWEPELDTLSGAVAAFSRPAPQTDILHSIAGHIIQHPAETDRGGRPRVFGGAIGTADTLQKSAIARDELRDRYRVRAIEMEAGGIQNAAWARGRDVMVIRGICDYCDTYKNDNWQGYAAAAAAAFTKAIMLAMPAEWFPSQLLNEHNPTEMQIDPENRCRTLRGLKQHVGGLLEKNRAIWQAFGPRSETAIRDPNSNVQSVWEGAKTEIIIPNNRAIINIIEANMGLLDAAHSAAYAQFYAHAAGYEAHTRSPVDAYPLFPTVFGRLFSDE